MNVFNSWLPNELINIVNYRLNYLLILTCQHRESVLRRLTERGRWGAGAHERRFRVAYREALGCRGANQEQGKGRPCCSHGVGRDVLLQPPKIEAVMWPQVRWSVLQEFPFVFRQNPLRSKTGARPKLGGTFLLDRPTLSPVLPFPLPTSPPLPSPPPPPTSYPYPLLSSSAPPSPQVFLAPVWSLKPSLKRNKIDWNVSHNLYHYPNPGAKICTWYISNSK